MKLIGQLLLVGFLAGCGAGAGNASSDAATGTSALALQGDHPGDHDRGFTVREVPLFVHLDGIGDHLEVATRIYRPEGRVEHRAVQLLLHGATYDGRYWEIPEINGVSYSYAEEMASRGYIVVVIDQLGAGDSFKPDGDAFGLPQASEVLDQVGAQIRQRMGPHHSLVYVGHSNGSVTALWSQGAFDGADGVVTTGWVNGFRGLPVDPTDPALGPVLAQPYIDMPGFLRAALFYYQPQTDPDVIAYDNANLANTMPRKQFLDLLGVHADIAQRGPGGMTTSTRTQEITVPVLVQAGMQDFAIAPASTVDNPPTEAGFFPLSPSVTVQKLDEIGHGFNGHYTHAESWDGIDAWLQATFP